MDKLKKRIPAFLLTAAMLAVSLTSCVSLMRDTQDTDADTPTSTPTEGPSGDTTNVPTNTPEKDPTVDEYGFTIFPEGNYLADPKFDTDEPLPDFDADISFINHLTTSYGGVCGTEDTIYSLPTHMVNHDTPLLLYTDRATGITMPLCGRPECTHSGPTCNAYMEGNMAGGLCVYDGKIYWENGYKELYRMNLDGTAREKVMDLDYYPKPDWASGNFTRFLHRGYFYMARVWQLVEDGTKKNRCVIYAKPLDGGESIVVMDRYVDVAWGYISARPVGNDLYITLTWTNVLGETEKKNSYNMELFRWSSKTRKGELLCASYDQERKVEDVTFSLPVPGDGIYLISSNLREGAAPDLIWGEQESEVGWAVDYTIIKYSFESGKLEDYSAFSVDYNYLNGLLTSQKHYLALQIAATSDGIRVFRACVFDFEGNLIASSEPSNEYANDCPMPMGEDNEYAYFFSFEPVAIIAVPLDGGEILEIRSDQ